MRYLNQLFAAAIVTAASHTVVLAQSDGDGMLDALVSGAADASGGIMVGNGSIAASGAGLIRGDDACNYSYILNADEYCTTDAILFPPQGAGIDSIYYYPPETIGHVNMDDWTADVSAQIDEIWESYLEGAKAQSERIGYDVVPIKWVLYPTLNKEAKVMTYGILLDFGGERVINLTSVKFTRNGYVSMDVVTDDEMLSRDWASYESVSAYAAGTYTPANGLHYADFQPGEKLASVGAVGVLAALVGTKKGQGWLAGIGATLAVLLKKFWFLLLALPAAIWGGMKRLARRD